MKSVVRIVIWIVMLGGGGWGGLLLDRHWFPGLKGNLWFHVASFVTGFILLRLVLTVSRNTGRTLARYGRQGNLPRLETNRLVTEGPYRHMRHPMHLGLLLFPFAVAFMAGSPTFILMIAPAEALFMLLMIKLVEEPEALRKFGEEYRNYMKQTPWFCLKKECLRALLQKVNI